MPRTLQCQVLFFFSYYEYLWLRNKGVYASLLFEGLPLSLKADISLSMYKDLIERVKSLLSFRLLFTILFNLRKGHIICNTTNLQSTVHIVKS